MGANAAHPLGRVGLQYVIWTADGDEDFERCERVLKARSALRDTRSSGGVKLVEGRDPDDTVVMVTYPGPTGCPPTSFRCASTAGGPSRRRTRLGRLLCLPELTCTTATDDRGPRLAAHSSP